MTFSLKDERPQWVAFVTTKDDSSIKRQLNNTFNLDILVEGLKQGVTHGTGSNILFNKDFIIDYDNNSEDQ